MSARGTIRVRINGDEREIPDGMSVTSLLEHLSLQPGLVVVERNGDILRREQYTQVDLESGDVIELVHFVGGGSERKRYGYRAGH